MTPAGAIARLSKPCDFGYGTAMFRNSPASMGAAAALFLPLAVAWVPANAQTRGVAEDSVIALPDKVEDAAPVVETPAAAVLPSWSPANATALLTTIQNIGSEGLFAKDYAPDALQAAIVSGDQAAIDEVATDTFLLLATHLRDGRTPNAARKQWFMDDSDGETTPLVSVMTTALLANNVAGALAGLNPDNPDFAALKTALAVTKDTATANILRVNMERWRWMPRDLGQRYIVSNVPEYVTRVMHSGRIIATHKAVVGKASTATPQLNAMATGIILNPTWTLPRSIINEGIGATIASNPARATAQGYTWTGKGPTLSVVQKAGPGNALGVMKLEMLNPHAIYLHDTPSKGAFAASARAFSHGCIRTEKALHFSGLMAVMFAGRSPEEFGEVVASGKTTRFGFDDPFPVYVAYWTMTPAKDGKLNKFVDIYGRDAPVIDSFSKPGRLAATVIGAPAALDPAIIAVPTVTRTATPGS